MGVDKFKFISPGVFLNEIDESGIPALPERMGPMIIGRFTKGPANRPVKVNSFKEFVSLFGYPSAGNAAGDIWRTGAATAPTYAAYAAQAWLRNNSPCTVFRVLGDDASTAADTLKGKAGWSTKNSSGTETSHGTDASSTGGAYGLFVIPNPDSYTGGTQATALITTVVEAAIVDTKDFTLTNTSGVTITYNFTGGKATSTNTVAYDATSDITVDIGYSDLGSGDAGLTGDQIVTRINGGTGIAMTATKSGDNVLVTQDVGGSAGNKTNTVESGMGDFAVANFTGGEGPAVTGTLGAVWYVNNGAVVLDGTSREATTLPGSAATWIKSDSGLSFTAKVLDSAAAAEKTAKFSFDRDSSNFIRKVFNTNPTLTNADVTPAGSTVGYWLGETFESNLRNGENSKLAITGTLATDSSNFLGTILALEGSSTAVDKWANHKQAAKAAGTQWFFSQDTRGGTTANFDPTSHVEKLFRFYALGGAGRTQDPGNGEVANRDIKISIQDIKPPTDKYNQYGTFSVVVRASADSDNNPTVLERFSGVDLRPTSPKYIGRVIGDKHYDFDSTNNVVREFGDNDNRSQYIRVKVSDAIANAEGEGLLPMGVYGPLVPATHEIISGSTQSLLADGSGSFPGQYTVTGIGSDHLVYTTNAFTASIKFPTARLRVSSSEGNMVTANKAYFGYNSSVKGTKRFDKTNLDLFRGMPAALDPLGNPSSGNTQYSWAFTLEDVKQCAGSATDHGFHASGSRADGTSWSAKSGSFYVLTGSDTGFDRFTSPVFGGFDGFDVTEPDPLRNSYMDTSTIAANSTYYSLKKAVDMAADKDFLEYDLVAMPGITNTSLNTQLVNAAEERGDALAVIDLAGNYKPPHERADGDTDSGNLGSVTAVTNEFKDMAINSSYGCTFYPFVKIRDIFSDSMLYVPPSVVALGTFSSAQRKSAVWFAPAGFTRGGLSEGSAGLPVVGVRQRLTSDNRDKLYDANINPIATFPAEGIVIFGQKTLQVTPSALDRINVRRLLIHTKKEISRIASKVLFDQNIQATWDRFKGRVIPFLEGIKAGHGLTDFKVMLDDSTTTPDLVDRNIMYAKIFLKPARAIEFIALDFIITRSGASFDD
jgi:hypothetical protein